MARLTNHDYLSRRRELRVQWIDESSRPLLLLTPSQQWALHMYYVPSMRISKTALLEHRATITAYDPTLPQRAGRALSRLRILAERLQAVTAAQPKPKKGSPYNIRVFVEVNPTLDVEKFVRILLNHKT